ncbi:hypothetical protein PWF83_19060 [Pantoea dispersa]|uniref:hypothetical protein n=1 Tax=Pantoea dispersa TaxID=59814 RepID=UPI0023A927B6|nr:hypothetical protein [Pantoea dispersa]WEA05762.1 hypothetical protein PWF83_19060 [Pantoea dispersa]
MTTVAIWLAFFSSLPVLYWLFSMLFDRVRFMLMPAHLIEIEYINDKGESSVQTINVSSDMEFYRVAMSAIRNGRVVRKAKKNDTRFRR